MKYFFDTEFIENGCTIDLVSIGIVDESGRALYLQNSQAQFNAGSKWVRRNVFPHLNHFDMKTDGRNCKGQSYDSGSGTRSWCWIECPWRSRAEIRDAIKDFIDPEKHGKPEIWGYYASYDWVAFCQLFGDMISLPNGYPMYCRDLKQCLDDRGNPLFQKEGPRHALSDAMWIRDAWIALQDQAGESPSKENARNRRIFDDWFLGKAKPALIWEITDEKKEKLMEAMAFEAFHLGLRTATETMPEEKSNGKET